MSLYKKGFAESMVKTTLAKPDIRRQFAKKMKAGVVIQTPEGPVIAKEIAGFRLLKGKKKAVKWVKTHPETSVASAVSAPQRPAKQGRTFLPAKRSVKREPSFVRKARMKALAKQQRRALAAPSVAPSRPESFPGEQAPSSESQSMYRDVLNAPDPTEVEQSTDEGDADNTSEQSSEDTTMSDEEVAGWDEIAGYGDEISGASNRSLGVRPKSASKRRRQVLGFTSASIAAAASASIAVVPQTLFRGVKLVVAAAIAPSFTIDDIKVGASSQYAASGSLPADAFGPTTTGERNMELDTANPGQSITITVTNTSAGALVFRAALFGDSVI